ncbi:hypothetical protein Q3G72_025132 [Acer saccharum]|nr:hypothetical protein Q3G72_025132 [Acer saccharum]
MNAHKTSSNSSDSSNSILSTKPSLICMLSSNQAGMAVSDDHLTQWNLLRSFYLRGDCDDIESGYGLIFRKLRFTDVVMKDPKIVYNQFIKIRNLRNSRRSYVRSSMNKTPPTLQRISVKGYAKLLDTIVDRPFRLFYLKKRFDLASADNVMEVYYDLIEAARDKRFSDCFLELDKNVTEWSCLPDDYF